MSEVIGVVTVDKKGRAVFPVALRQELGLVDGTQLRVERTDEGAYELVPAELVPRINDGDRPIHRSEAGTAYFIDIVSHDEIAKYGRR